MNLARREAIGEAVRAALKRQYINVLITDEYIADYLLETE